MSRVRPEAFRKTSTAVLFKAGTVYDTSQNNLTISEEYSRMDFTSPTTSRLPARTAQHRSFSRAAEVPLHYSVRIKRFDKENWSCSSGSGCSTALRGMSCPLPTEPNYWQLPRRAWPKWTLRCLAHRTLREPSQPVFDFGCAALDRNQYRHPRDQGIPWSPARSSDSVVRRKIACHPTTCPRRQARRGSWHLRSDARYQAHPILSFSSDGDPARTGIPHFVEHPPRGPL